MKWRPWPPPMLTKKYDVKVVVKKVKGWCDQVREGVEEDHCDEDHQIKLTVEIRWKGPPNEKKVALMRRKSSIKSDITKEVEGNQNGAVFQWDEEFHSVCTFSSNKDNCNSFLPWEIGFSLLHVSVFLFLFLRNVFFCQFVNLVGKQIGIRWVGFMCLCYGLIKDLSNFNKELKI